MTWTLIRFIITCAIGVVAILALLLGPRLMRRRGNDTSASGRVSGVWILISTLGILLDLATADASSLGWHGVDADVLSWVQYLIFLTSGAAIFIALWHLPSLRFESASARDNERPTER
jgi:hypothetical protein